MLLLAGTLISCDWWSDSWFEISCSVTFDTFGLHLSSVAGCCKFTICPDWSNILRPPTLDETAITVAVEIGNEGRTWSDGRTWSEGRTWSDGIELNQLLITACWVDVVLGGIGFSTFSSCDMFFFGFDFVCGLSLEDDFEPTDDSS